MKLDINKKELLALLDIIDCNPCESTCVWNSCKSQDCDTCDFTKAKDSLITKIERLAEQYDIIK